jgi:hypothetical protein
MERSLPPIIPVAESYPRRDERTLISAADPPGVQSGATVPWPVADKKIHLSNVLTDVLLCKIIHPFSREFDASPRSVPSLPGGAFGRC